MKLNRPVPNPLKIAADSLRFVLTEPGGYLLGLFVMAMMPTLVTLNVPIFHVFATMGALGVIAFVVALVFLPRCRLSGGPPDKAVAGQEVLATYQVRNLRLLPAWDLSLMYFNPPAGLKEVRPNHFLKRLGGRKTGKVQIRLLPLRRGFYELRKPICFSTFPLNLFRAARRRARGADRMVVLPSFHRLDSVAMDVAPRYQLGGVSMTSNIGESPEYIGNRGFRPGDSLRRLDTRAWARLAAPVVKEYAEEYYCRLALVLDTLPRGRRPGPEGHPDVEAGVSLTAAVADAVSRGEYIIDIFAAGPDLYVFRTGRHTSHFDSVLEILAGVEACKSDPFDRVAPALSEELGSISGVVFCLLNWDEPRRELVRAAAQAGCATKVLVVRDKPTTLPTGEDEDWAGPIRVVTPAQVQAEGLGSL